VARRRTAAKPRAEAAQVRTDPDVTQRILDGLLPFLEGSLETLGLAAQATGEEGDRQPGSTNAAVALLGAIQQALTGQHSDKARLLLDKITQLRKASIESATD